MPRLTHLSLELLETFVTLVRHGGNAARAARTLRINQPSMSKRLKHLKDKGKVLSEPWIQRDGKAWKVTREGRQVLPAVQELIARYRLLQHFSTSAKPAPQSELRFGCGQTAALELVPDALVLWRDSWPHAQFALSTTMRDAELVEGVASGALDLALVSHSQAELKRESRVPMLLEQLVSYGFLAVCAPDSHWAEAMKTLPQTIPLKALMPFPLIVPESGTNTREALDRTIIRKKLEEQFHIIMETGGWHIILEYARRKHGVAIVSEAAKSYLDGLIVRQIDRRDLPQQHLKILTRKDPGKGDGAVLTDIARDWRDALIKTAHRDRGS